MSALARYFNAAGSSVAGYDITPSHLTLALESEGIQVIYDDQVSKIPVEYQDPDERLLVIRTPAVPITSPLISFYLDKGSAIKKRSEVLAELARSKRCIAIAGTHGKTTTTSILGHILHQSELGCTAFIGGVLTGYDSNLLIDPESDIMVLEADEFDRSFHHLAPESAVITSLDADHLDVYGSEEVFIDAFKEFARSVKGRLLVHDEASQHFDSHDLLSYGIEQGTLRATNIRVISGRFFFDLEYDSMRLNDLSVALPGRHNILNTTAAIGVCISLGISEKEIRSGLEGYLGVKRRFEIVHQQDELVFIDDYAHHPSEIRACIDAVRELYPSKRITVVFQPHLYSRTRDFMTGFADTLSQADELILLPIYPARESPIAGVTSEVLLEQIRVTNKVLCEKEEVPTLIAQRELEVLLTLGAGDIDRQIPLISDELKKQVRPERT